MGLQMILLHARCYPNHIRGVHATCTRRLIMENVCIPDMHEYQLDLAGQG